MFAKHAAFKKRLFYYFGRHTLNTQYSLARGCGLSPFLTADTRNIHVDYFRVSRNFFNMRADKSARRIRIGYNNNAVFLSQSLNNGAFFLILKYTESVCGNNYRVYNIAKRTLSYLPSTITGCLSLINRFTLCNYINKPYRKLFKHGARVGTGGFKPFIGKY